MVTQQPRKPKRKDTQVPQPSDPIENVADEAVHEELGDYLVRAATTASSLKAEQDNGNINKTQSKATPNESSSLGTTSGGGPRFQETMGGTITQTRFENVSKHSNDSLLTRGNTLQSDEDRLKLDELMALCTTLQNKVLDLGLTAKVESSDNEESLGEDASKQGRINDIDVDEEITLVSVQNVDEEMFDVTVLDEQEVAAKDVNLTVDEVNLAQHLPPTHTRSFENLTNNNLLQSPTSLRKGMIITELGYTYNTRSSQQPIIRQSPEQRQRENDRTEPVKKMSKKDQLRSDEEEAKRYKLELMKRKTSDHDCSKTDNQGGSRRLYVEEKAKIISTNSLEQRIKHFAAKSCRREEEQTSSTLQPKLNKGKIISTKKQKVDEDKDTTELQSLIEVIPDEEEVAIDAVPLATKPPTIVKANNGSNKTSGKDMELCYGGDLKTLFEPHKKDEIWKFAKQKGRIIGIKSLLNAASITAAHIRVNAFNCVSTAVVSKGLDSKKNVKRYNNYGESIDDEATCSKEINETGINKNEPPRFEQDV
ncbi:hypothetical protein Tco_1509934 [Tanacetum coccineum]